jgi:hypothetical protein
MKWTYMFLDGERTVLGPLSPEERWALIDAITWFLLDLKRRDQ